MKPRDVVFILTVYMTCFGQSESQSACTPNPCRNGATCFAGAEVDSYFCKCPHGYTGTDCEVDICTAQAPCENGGSCLLNSTLPLGYECRCIFLFEGETCQTMISDACSSSPCMNEGTCYRAYSDDTPANLSYICICTLEYTGIRCETAIIRGTSDVCDVMRPCLNNGTCFASSSNDMAYICRCLDGFTGEQCQHQNIPDRCLSYNPCENNSTCVHLSGASSITCQCAPGYVGAHCERVDTGNGDCLPNPCGNGATCNPDPFVSLGYTCTCPPAFSGYNCQLEYFGCLSDPCQSGGTCVVHTYGTYYCLCPAGYIGRLCEIPGPCVSAPCVNGGICQEIPQVRDPTVRAYNCKCQTGFMGSHCEQLSTGDPCSPDPCYNNGVCFKSGSEGGSHFVCQCPELTVGYLCNDDPCLSVPCLNGGSCEPIFNPVTRELVAIGCLCPTGYTGPTCAVVGPCQSNPCQHGGTCIDSTGSSPDPLMDWDSPISAMLAFFCMCPEDWIGTTCSERSDPCSTNLCENGGTCVRMGERTYTCLCPEQYHGDRCESKVDPCSPNPCLNSGMCVAVGDSYSCVCSSPYVGSHCERSDPCASDPCRNNATCYRSWQNELVICSCAPGFTGTFCEERIDPCLSLPCHNGGQCYTGITSFRCTCSPEFTGALCEEMIDPCLLNPCQNGGTCFTGRTSFRCACPVGFSGDHCELMVDPCLSNPCFNGGQCFTGKTGFWCQCLENYMGVQCTDRVTTTSSQPTTRPDIYDACTPNPCFNQGTCLPIGSGLFSYTCLCPMHYAGLTCGVHLQPLGVCDPNPCMDGETCVPYTGLQEDYVCICGNIFTGDSCVLFSEIRPSSSTESPTTTPLITTASSAGSTTSQQPPGSSTITGSSTQESISSTNQASTFVTETATTFATSTFEPQICFHASSVYEEGATRVNDCVQCTCINGEWLCGERNCDCMIDGIRYKNADTWTDDCNTCICNGGVEFCTQMNCGKTCSHNGVYYVNGDSRQNDCNTCMCVEGDWMCTDNICGDACLFGADTFLEGEMRKESCNSCFCLKDAQWLCTVRDCEGSPIIISVSFKINHEFAAIQGSQQDFIQVFKDDMRKRYNLSKQNIQNVMVFPGSILVMFDLVEVKDSNINVEAVASDLQFKVQGRNYTLTYQGLDLFPNPNSYVQEKLETGSVEEPTTFLENLSQETIILIAVVGCGALGLIVVVASVCYFTRRAPRRERTEYGDTRLPRVSDNDNGFVNNGYQETIAESHITNTDDSLPRHHRITNMN